jgi:DNA-binding CsgD family transcriptional regulator
LIEEVFGDGSIELILVRETGIDLTTPYGRGIAQLLNTSNAIICDIGSQIVRDASRRRRKAGYPVKPAFGWRWKENKDANNRRGIEPHPEQAEIVKLIINRFLGGKGTRAIGQELVQLGVKTATGSHRWFRNTVDGIVRQPLHYGRIRLGDDEYVQGAHFEQRFFDPDVLEEVERQFSYRSGQRAFYERRPEYLLGGALFCGHCGTRARGRCGQGRFRVYACQAEPFAKQTECPRNTCRADHVEGEVLDLIRGIIASPEVAKSARQEAMTLIRGERKSLIADIAQLETELQRMDVRFLRWSQLLADEVLEPEEYRRYQNELAGQRAEMERKLAEARDGMDGAQDNEAEWARVERALADLPALWEEMTPEERRELMLVVVERVDMRREEDGGTELTVKLRMQDPVTRRIPAPSSGKLTRRQKAVLWHLGQGLTRLDASRRLGISPRSVTSLLSQAHRRLGVDTVDEAVSIARDTLQDEVKWLDLDGRSNRSKRPATGWPQLTPEESEVLSALADGLRGTGIGVARRKAPSTVYVHLHNMRAKFGAANNRQLLQFAREAGLLPGPPVGL